MKDKQARYYLSNNPCRQNDVKRWFKSIKNTNTIGGEIVANAFGNTKEIAEQRALIILKALND